MSETHGRSVEPSTPLTESDVFIFPLSFAQQRLWVLDRLEPNSAVYNISIPLRLTGPLNVQILEKSFTEIVRRHEALRVSFEQHDDAPVQIVNPDWEIKIALADLSSLPREAAEAEARRLALTDAQTPFDLARPPLFRVTLLKLGELDHVLLFSVHHIIFDGWSGRILLRELMSCYQALHAGQAPQLPDLPLQYADYTMWQRDYMSGEQLSKPLLYWKQQLAGAPGSLELAADHPRPARQSFQGAKLSLLLSADLLHSLNQLSRAENATLFMTLLAAFDLLLARYSGQEDIVVGTPIAGRNREELEGLIGFFVNTLVLRTNLSGNPTFRQLLARVREMTLNAYSHQDLPFEKLVEELKPERDLARNPVFQVMFAFQKTPPDAAPAACLAITPFEQGDGAGSKFDLTVTMTEKSGGLRVTFEYSTDLFEPTSIHRMQQHFQNLLQAICARPDAPLSELSLLTSAERVEIVEGFNETAFPYDRELCIHTAFEQQVARTPHKTALLFRGQPLAFSDLNARANRLARFLIRNGVHAGMRVGVCLERSPEMVAALLAILKIGAAYVPLEPSYPAPRLAFMMEDAAVAAVITSSTLPANVPVPGAGTSLFVDIGDNAIQQESAENLGIPADSGQAAYLIYTSGSTGAPKGVQGTHRGAINRFAWMWRTFPFTAEDTCCQKTTLGFVDSVWEIFGPLLQGIPNVIVPQEDVLDPAALIRTLAQNRVTRLVLVPSLLRLLLDFEPDLARRLPQLKLWSCSGEILPADLAQRFLRTFPDATLLNIYGCSEVAADVTCHVVTTNDTATVPIGRPLANTQIYVLDSHKNPVPVGVPGNIHVGGDCLAIGYWNRPDLTAQRFVPNPIAPHLSPRLYDTGDLGKFMADGTLVYLGRSDNQVKIRGYRIEPSEIERVIEQHPDVNEAVALVRAANETERLVAYVIPKPGRKISVPDLRVYVQQLLPAFMVPNLLLVLDTLPLNENGKLDRSALPLHDLVDPAQITPPRDKTELLLMKIWERVLGLTSPSVTANFFDVGGHSLLAVRLLSEIRKETGQEIPLATLFQNATIENLASVLRDRLAPRHDVVAPVQPEGCKPPLFGIVVPGANPLGYAALARHLGPDQPVYRVQGPGLRLRMRPYTASEFEDLAAKYIDGIKKVQPHGPYYLCGMCEGARIAFDMARLLEAKGDSVALLGILDTWVLENSQNRFLWKVDYYSTRVRSFWRSSRSEKWKSFQRWLRNHQGTIPRRQLWPETYWPGEDFVPARYSGKITVFKVPKQPYYYINDPLLGWGSRTTGEVEIHSLAVDARRHMLLFREPYVQELAAALRKCLNQEDETPPDVHSGAEDNLSRSICVS